MYNVVPWTPLQYCCAIRGGHELVRFLLENGADPSIKDKNGRTALDIAKCFETIQILANYNQEMTQKKIQDLKLENQNLSLCSKDPKHIEKMAKDEKNVEFFIQHSILLNGIFINFKGDLSELELLGAVISLESLSKKCNQEYVNEIEKSRLLNSINEIIQLWKSEKLSSSIQKELDEECKRNMTIRIKIKKMIWTTLSNQSF